MTRVINNSTKVVPLWGLCSGMAMYSCLVGYYAARGSDGHGQGAGGIVADGYVASAGRPAATGELRIERGGEPYSALQG